MFKNGSQTIRMDRFLVMTNSVIISLNNNSFAFIPMEVEANNNNKRSTKVTG